MFEKIVSYNNLKAAYLEIAEKFIEDCKSLAYHGLDNFSLRDYDLDSDALIITAQKELLQKKEIEPALLIKIPKKNNPEKTREIFIYNVKERIKAQAIARILLPEFEKNFSDRLFSYRPGKPPYLAAKNFCHRYRKNYSSDQALIIDLENYSDLIDKNILLAQLQKIFTNQDVLDLLRLFIFNKIYRDGQIISPDRGLVQGVPLIALFANLYLSDLDFKYQQRAPFYIRVGDDIAILDKNLSKLEKTKIDLISDLQARGLVVNAKKLFFGAAQDNFGFLGYNFNQGLISLEASFVKRIELDWKKILIYKNLSDEKKDRLLFKIMSQPKNNFNFQFFKIVQDKSQVNNSEQIRKVSEDFFKTLTRFFYKTYSPRRRRLLNARMKGVSIQSLYETYRKFHYDRD